MSQAGAQGTDDMQTLFSSTAKENAGSASVEQVPVNVESLGLLGTAAAQELPALPVISPAEHSAVIPHNSDGRSGVIDLGALRRRQEAKRLETALMDTVHSFSPDTPVEQAPLAEVAARVEQISRIDSALQTEHTPQNVADQIEARTNEIRQLQRQRAEAQAQVVELETIEQSEPEVAVQPSGLAKVLEFVLPGRRTESAAALFQQRQQKKRQAA